MLERRIAAHLAWMATMDPRYANDAREWYWALLGQYIKGGK